VGWERVGWWEGGWSGRGRRIPCIVPRVPLVVILSRHIQPSLCSLGPPSIQPLPGVVTAEHAARRWDGEEA